MKTQRMIAVYTDLFKSSIDRFIPSENRASFVESVLCIRILITKEALFSLGMTQALEGLTINARIANREYLLTAFSLVPYSSPAAASSTAHSCFVVCPNSFAKLCASPNAALLIVISKVEQAAAESYAAACRQIVACCRAVQKWEVERRAGQKAGRRIREKKKLWKWRRV